MTKDQRPESESSINSAESSDTAVQTEPKRRRKSRRAGKSKQLERASSRALRAVDDLNEVREVIRAFDCISDLLAPHRSPAGDSYFFEIADLRSLMIATNAELSRRVTVLRRTVESNSKILFSATRPPAPTSTPAPAAEA